MPLTLVWLWGIGKIYVYSHWKSKFFSEWLSVLLILWRLAIIFTRNFSRMLWNLLLEWKVPLFRVFFFFFFMLHYTWNLDKMLIFHPHVLLFESQHHFKTLLYWTQTIVIFRFYSWSYSSPENHFFFFSPGGLVLCGGLFGYIFSKNPASLRTSLFFGGPLLALSTLSLKVWGKGESSLPFILGQAGIASLQ